MAEHVPVSCPVCNKPMRLVSVIPSLSFSPALHTYECGTCKEVRTVEARPARGHETPS
jgi:hypothetical protein